jgi:hypothetical protein
VLTATGEMFYFASPEETPGRMTDLVDWYRAEEAAPTLHPVALAAEFHYRFVRIHPFDDGNGRMSRLLMNLILLRHGYPMTVIQAADRNRYLAALAEADAGEPEPFLRFIIENVEAGLRLMIRAARGESIDEPSDLDKKLALLKKQVLTREDALEMAWNLETQAKIWDILLKHWIQDLATQLSKFDEFFLEKNIKSLSLNYLSVPPKPGKIHLPWTGYIYNEDNTLEGASELAAKQLSNGKYLFRSFYFKFEWLDFRMPEHAFNTNLVLMLIFTKLGYEVLYTVTESVEQPDSNSFNPILKEQYRTDPIHDQIHEINYQLATKVYDFIAAKLAEADTPPA